MIGGTLFFTDLLQSFKNRKIVMLAWQCRMACSMLDDFFALGYKVEMTLFEIFIYLLLEYILRIVLDDVQSNPTQGICLFCRVRFLKELKIFAWFYVKSIFFEQVSGYYQELKEWMIFDLSRNWNFILKATFRTKWSFSIKDSVLNWMCSPYWKILRLWKNCLG